MRNSSALNSILAPWMMIRCACAGMVHVLVEIHRLFRECLMLSRTAGMLQIAIHEGAELFDRRRGLRERRLLLLRQRKPHDFLDAVAPQLHRHAHEQAVRSEEHTSEL